MNMLSDTQSAYVSSPGKTAPQGANLVDQYLRPASSEQASGVNFSVYAPKAAHLFLSLFDDNGQEEQLAMVPSSEGVWHLYVEGIGQGQHYAFRADGHWSPEASPRFNRHKLLLDPYAREVKGDVQWCEQLFDYAIDNKHRDNKHWVLNEQDSAPYMPRCVVREAEFDWQGVRQPHIPDQQSVIYETHLKGFTQTHPEIPEHIRGSYLGMSHPVTIAYLQDLGITAVELLPVTSKVSEERLAGLGLKNYWGYNPICMMAPEAAFAIEDPVTEMKTMVRELHRAGIEVIMDVVFNHTCEAGHGGPFLSMRGLAEDEYYHMDNQDGEISAVNYSGCGNTMNFDSHQTLKLTMDSLRCWVEEYQIDGFRFDLAPTMARQHRHFSKDSPFFYAISQDPVLSQMKMIAEPWDIGPEGYHVTGFPNDWQSWNDRYRDGCRKFWKGKKGAQTEMALRFTGSEDMFTEQSYLATVNYICSHDGFNLMDLVSYNQRHNQANGEDGRDGDEHNHSWNHGVEGKTDSAEVNNARLKSRKNLIGMLMLAKGTPMLLAGDEFSNSQDGNNNAYCQDSPIAWMDWSWLQNPLESDGAKMNDFTRQMIHLRRNEPLLTDDLNNTVYQLYSPEGNPVNAGFFKQHNCHTLTIKIHAPNDQDKGALWVMMNSGKDAVTVQMPELVHSQSTMVIVDSSEGQSFINQPLIDQSGYKVLPHSLVVLKALN